MGDSWVDDIKKARVYTRIGHARTQVAFWATNYPDYGVPEIVALHVTATEVLDEKERVEAAVTKKEQAKQAARLRREEAKLARAEEEARNARAVLAGLKKG